MHIFFISTQHSLDPAFFFFFSNFNTAQSAIFLIQTIALLCFIQFSALSNQFSYLLYSIHYYVHIMLCFIYFSMTYINFAVCYIKPSACCIHFFICYIHFVMHSSTHCICFDMVLHLFSDLFREFV